MKGCGKKALGKVKTERGYRSVETGRDRKREMRKVLALEEIVVV